MTTLALPSLWCQWICCWGELWKCPYLPSDHSCCCSACCLCCKVSPLRKHSTGYFVSSLIFSHNLYPPWTLHFYNSPKAEVFPFSYNYAVIDDYSGSAFTASESNNKLGARSVTYSTDDVIGYVAEVSYEGAPTYPQTTAVVAQPAVSVARSPLGESTAQATSYLV